MLALPVDVLHASSDVERMHVEPAVQHQKAVQFKSNIPASNYILYPAARCSK